MRRAILATFLTLAGAATADEPKEVDPASGREIRYQERTEIPADAFNDLGIDGHVVGPGIAVSSERRKLVFPPLYRPRMDFAPEMIQSVNEVK